MTGSHSHHNSAPAPVMSAKDILAKMREGVKSSSEIRLRGQIISVRVLSVDEMNTIRREAIMFVQKTPGADDVDKNVFVQKKTLLIASTPEPGGFPTIPESLMGSLSVDELNYLYDEYIKAMDDVNPSVEMLDAEKLRALIEAVKKNNVSARDCSLLQLKVIFSLFQDLIKRQATQESPKDS